MSPGSNSGVRPPSGDPESASLTAELAAALRAEAGGDHGDPHFRARLVVDHGPEDHVRVLVGGAGHDLSRLVHLEQTEIASAR